MSLLGCEGLDEFEEVEGVEEGVEGVVEERFLGGT
jgi:hypothetical protein